MVLEGMQIERKLPLNGYTAVPVIDTYNLKMGAKMETWRCSSKKSA